MKKKYHKGSLKKLSEEDLKILTRKSHDVEASQKPQDNSFISDNFDVNDLDPSKHIAMGGYYGT